MSSLAFTAAAALFDMDGTLVDSNAVVEQIWREFCREHGVDEDVLVPWSHGRRTTDTVRHFLPGMPDDEVQSIVDDLQEREQTTFTGVVEIPGARALLESIQIPWAVVTSATRRLAVRRMQAVGLPVPEVLVPADEIERGKPHPDGYLEAAARLGVEARGCVVIGDIGADVDAATAAGAVGILVPTPVTRKSEVAAAPRAVKTLAAAVDDVLAGRW